jgi:hypothetical protein
MNHLLQLKVLQVGWAETKEDDNAAADPFGLDDLFANESKKHDRSRGKEVSNLNKRKIYEITERSITERP